jgi:hypothetical protein
MRGINRKLDERRSIDLFDREGLRAKGKEGLP